MTRVMGLLVFALFACGHKTEEAKVDPRAAAGFARALEAVAGVDPTQSAAMLAQGAYETIAPSMKCFESFASAGDVRKRVEALLDCGLACTPDAVQALKRKEPRSWMAALAGACDPQHFGLEKANAAMLSPEWFLLHKIGEIAQRDAGALKGPDRAKLEQAMAGYRLPLPMPATATGLYDLPPVPETASVPVATRTYVIVGSSGAIRVGATPMASLGPRGAAMTAPDGQVGFPGNEVARADLRAAVLEAGGRDLSTDAVEPPDAAPPAPADAAPPKGQYRMKASRDPQLARKQAIDEARAAGILGSAALQSGGAFASLTGTGGAAVAGLGGDVDPALRGDSGGAAADPPVPLVLADGGRPAAEVLEIAAGLDHVLVAVAAPEDTGARALSVDLERWMLGGASPGDESLRVALAQAGSLEAAKQQIAGHKAEQVIIAVDGPSPWRDAVALAAEAIARGAKRIVFTTPNLEGPNGWDAAGTIGHGGGTGSAGALLGHGAYGQGTPAASLMQEGEPTATGDLDKNLIRRVMRAHVVTMRTCYERELARKPELAGRVDLEFTIAADGTVAEAKGTGLDTVADCIVGQLRGFKFPRPRPAGKVNVRYPLVFKPKE